MSPHRSERPLVKGTTTASACDFARIHFLGAGLEVRHW